MDLKCIIATETSVKQALKSSFHLSNRLLSKLKNGKKITCNDKTININDTTNTNDILKVNLDFEEESENILEKKMDLNILYEDDALLILNKPAYMPVHPSINHYTDSLSNGVKFYFNTLGLKRKIRPINRLDKDTSGIVVFAKNEYVQECLIKQMKSNEFEKEYLAIVDGVIMEKNIKIEANIAREADSIITRCISQDGAYASTLLQVIRTFKEYTLVKCILETGRTHQIRVHMKYINHPILGDSLYGKASNLISRQALHAYRIKFNHPITKERITITCDIPEDMKKLVKRKIKGYH